MCKQILLRQICPCTKAPSKEVPLTNARVLQTEISPCCMLGTDIAEERKTRMGLAARREAAAPQEEEKWKRASPSLLLYRVTNPNCKNLLPT